jgi:hypothetical protein
MDVPDARSLEAMRLMMRFSERTGLSSEHSQQRYLWTDAFAVCNFLGMAQATGVEQYSELGLRLIDRVHYTLARHRPDDARSGWISGLEERRGASHPTQGGLRIGKRLPERPPGEAFDERLEWDRDGQYFHYLTKWMHALDQASRFTRDPRFNRWARELAEVAFRAFACSPPGGRGLRMAWKMSIDLSRPLVSSMGHHDALDGLVTYAELQATASLFGATFQGPSLEEAVAGFTSMCKGGEWATSDPLGLGGLLMDACYVEQLIGQGSGLSPELLPTLLEAALEGLPHYVRYRDVEQPASGRLAFRELGLSIGLHAAELMSEHVEAEPSRFSSDHDLSASLKAIRRYTPLGSAIESFWLVPQHQESETWIAHCDINEVMLATSLMPQGCLVLAAT